MSANVRVIFFDFGDTLVYVEPPAEVLWRKLLRDLVGLDVALERIQQALRTTDAQLVPQVFAYHGRMEAFWQEYDQGVLERLGLPSGQAKRLAPTIARAFEEREPELFHLFPETREVLEALRARGYRLGMISNNVDDLLRRMAKLGLDQHFESVTYSQEVGTEKPDPHIFKVALERMGCAPKEAMHVGDLYEADVVGARAVGLMPVLIDRRDRYPQADCWRIRDLLELLTALG